jgi:TolA-binding protein
MKRRRQIAVLTVFCLAFIYLRSHASSIPLSEKESENKKLITVEGGRQVFKPADWINWFVKGHTPREDEDMKVGPGYYTFDLEAYCLDIGSASPPEGASYMLGPASGRHAELINNISLRLMDHPEIPQDEIQRFIWGIQCGVNFQDYSFEFQQLMSPLLTRREIFRMSVDWGDLLERFLPDRLMAIIDRVEEMRERLIDFEESIEDLQEVAFINQEMEEEEREEEEETQEEPGNWAYIGQGLYARVYPYNFQLMRYEIFKPAPYILKRDSLDRVTQFQSGDCSIEIKYTLGSIPEYIISADGQDQIPIWRIAILRLKHPSLGKEVKLENVGWVLASNTELSSIRSVEASGPFSPEELLNYRSGTDSPGWNEVAARRDRDREVKDLEERISDYAGDADESALKDMEDLAEVEAMVKNIHEQMGETLGASVEYNNQKMAEAAAARAAQASAYAASSAADDCPPPPSGGAVSDSALDSLIRDALSKVPAKSKNIKYQSIQVVGARRG